MRIAAFFDVVSSVFTARHARILLQAARVAPAGGWESMGCMAMVPGGAQWKGLICIGGGSRQPPDEEKSR